ncbi:putative ring-box protein [Histomonas meleagridis]|uniref:putative ring-box protein n=1 Tax=Histomonas meleagridis TaxID=135588 RepID=UPI003559C528|nr:putative ring-box protein [Histomonas meleagridis]KAH0801138.1 putative ring-box protein [Histomonas meleagridis]
MSENTNSAPRPAPRPTRIRSPATGKPPPKKTEVKEPRYTMLRFNPVYLSRNKNDNDLCSICRSLIAGPCAQCEADDVLEPCPPEIGACGHSYHMHCIRKWIASNPNCPICGEKWEAVD